MLSIRTGKINFTSTCLPGQHYMTDDLEAAVQLLLRENNTNFSA